MHGLGLRPRNHDYHTQPDLYTGADMPNPNQVYNKTGNSHSLKKQKTLSPESVSTLSCLVRKPGCDPCSYLLGFVSNSLDLTRMSMTSKTMNKYTVTEANSRILETVPEKNVFYFLYREENRPLFMEKIERFRLSKPGFYEQLIKVFNNDPLLTELSYKRIYIGNAGAEALANALQFNTCLSLLVLYRTQIGDAGVEALAMALQTNTSLRKLYLGNNKIGKPGAEALAKALGQNKSLKKLTLDTNQIEDIGAIALANVLQHHNTSLTELYLGNNKIGDPGAKAFVSIFQSNNSLKILNLEWNQIGDKCVQSIDNCSQLHGLHKQNEKADFCVIS